MTTDLSQPNLLYFEIGKQLVEVTFFFPLLFIMLMSSTCMLYFNF